MSTIAPVFVEFRCNRCWYSNCADSEAVGTEVECRNCSQNIMVPEATTERVERALALLQAEPELAEKKAPLNNKPAIFDRQTSNQELIDIAKRESFVPLNQIDFLDYPPASLLARLIANVLDGVFLVASMILGFVFLQWMAKLGIAQNPLGRIRTKEELSLASLMVMGLIPTLLVLGQWILLAISGQTLGKKLLMIRIVSESGKLPGFLQAVVMRNWLRFAFSLIPFFAFIDVLFIFSDSRRCLHDYMAGTKVISLA